MKLTLSTVITLLLALAQGQVFAATRATKPNIVFILIDDMPW